MEETYSQNKLFLSRNWYSDQDRHKVLWWNYIIKLNSYTCGEHSIIYRVVGSLCCTPETNVTLCQRYFKIIINNNFLIKKK